MILKEDFILANKVKMPKVGFGTWRIENEKDILNSIKVALDTGYRLIDTAWFYQNHIMIKKALKKLNVNRKDLFITTKMWDNKYPLDKNDVLKDIDKFLDELGLDYLDLILIHWPFADSLILWEGFEEAYKQGKVKAIGVSNFTVNQLEDFNKKVKIKPMVNQIQLHPYLPRTDVLEYCQKNNIIVTSWQTINEGKLLTDKVIVDLAKKYNAKPSQICLKWAIQNDIAIIPKSVHKDRIIENAKLDDFKLSKEDMKLLNKLEGKDKPKTLLKKLYKSDFEFDKCTWNNL